MNEPSAARTHEREIVTRWLPYRHASLDVRHSIKRMLRLSRASRG